VQVNVWHLLARPEFTRRKRGIPWQIYHTPH